MAANGIPPSAIPDLIKTTLADFKDRDKMAAAWNFRNPYFINEVFDKYKYQTQSGTSVEFRIVRGGNGSARHAGRYATRTNHNVVDTMRVGTAPWCFADAEMIYEMFEIKANRSPAKLASLMDERAIACWADLSDEIERRAVLTPNDSSDTENPLGLSYWLPMLNSGVTDYAGQFGGQTATFGDGTTTTTIGGINRANEPLLRNWAACHTGVGPVLFDTIRRGMIMTNFRPPRNVKQMYTGPTKKLRILCSLTNQAEYSRLVNSGSDNRNGDLSPFGTELNFSGVRVIGIDGLEGNAYNPFYVVNFGVFRPIVHSDVWFMEDEPLRDRDQRSVWTVGVTCWYNYICDNPREAGFVVHTPR